MKNRIYILAKDEFAYMDNQLRQIVAELDFATYEIWFVDYKDYQKEAEKVLSTYNATFHWCVIKPDKYGKCLPLSNDFVTVPAGSVGLRDSYKRAFAGCGKSFVKPTPESVRKIVSGDEINVFDLNLKDTTNKYMTVTACGGEKDQEAIFTCYPFPTSPENEYKLDFAKPYTVVSSNNPAYKSVPDPRLLV